MANTPHLDELMKNGSYSLAARTIMPTSSGPAWSSMITGTTVERHGVWKNGWRVDNKILEPVLKVNTICIPPFWRNPEKLS
jgi:predicted AlkP superfamily phosphohydrolase/phosphomutase